MHGVFTLLNSLVVKYTITQNLERILFADQHWLATQYAAIRGTYEKGVRLEDSNHKLMESRI